MKRRLRKQVEAYYREKEEQAAALQRRVKKARKLDESYLAMPPGFGRIKLPSHRP
jgi:hypothetical protein